MHPIVRLDGVSKVFLHGPPWRRRATTALRGVDLELQPGSRVVVVGESGSGKTTLARIITGLEPPTAGRVIWYGQPLTPAVVRQHRRKIQYVHQDPYASLHPAKTVFRILGDPLAFHERLRGAALRERVEALLARVGLTPASYFLDKYPHHLSGGGRQRVAVARALTAQPELVVADEPVSMVDMSLRAGIIGLFKTLDAELGIATVLILHDVGAARYFVYDKGEALVLYRGTVVERGPGRRVFTQPRHPYTTLLLVASPRLGRGGEAGQAEERRAFLEAAAGRPDTGVVPGHGCPFAPRCPFVEARCQSEEPALRPVDAADDHQVACHFAERLQPQLQRLVAV